MLQALTEGYEETAVDRSGDANGTQLLLRCLVLVVVLTTITTMVWSASYSSDTRINPSHAPLTINGVAVMWTYGFVGFSILAGIGLVVKKAYSWLLHLGETTKC